MTVTPTTPPRRPPAPPAQSGRVSLADAPPQKPPAPAAATRALWALFWKDFRLLFPLALTLLAGVAVMIGLIHFYSHYHPLARVKSRNLLLEDWVIMLVAGGCPFAGLCIGVFQARSDRADDQWALLVHRPVSGSVIFLGRVAAGLGLYCVAAGIPVAVLLVYAATQGGPPFEWHFMLPTVADWLSGLVYYFCGMLIVQRSAHILGSRLVPLAGAAGCTLLLIVVPRFSQALLVIGGFVMLYGLSALGAQISNGYRLTPPLLARAANMLLLFACYCGLGVLASYGIASYVLKSAEAESNIIWQMPEAQTPEWRAIRSRPLVEIRYVLLPDGTLGKSVYTSPPSEIRSRPGYKPSDSTQYFRVGPPETPVTTEELQKNAALNQTLWFFRFRPAAHYREMGPSRVVDLANERWWYLAPAGVFQGYDLSTGAYLGSLGENGFAPPGHFAVPFRVALSDAERTGGQLRLVNAHGEFSVNIAERKTVLNWRFPPGEGIIGTSDFLHPRFGPSAPVAHHIDFAAREMFVYAGDNPNPVQVVPLAHSASTHGIRVTHIPAQKLWAVWYLPRENEDRHNSVDFYDESWHLTSHIDVPLAREVVREGFPPPWLLALQERMQRKLTIRLAVGNALCNLPAVALVSTLAGEPSFNHFDRIYYYYVSLSAAQTNDVIYTPAYYSTYFITLSICAAGMFLLARRYGLRHGWLWVAATFLFGPIIPLLMVTTRPLPRRLNCPQCGKPRFTTDGRCRRCGTSFAGPARNGTEIFPQPQGAAV